MDSVIPESQAPKTVQSDVWTIGRTLQWMTDRFSPISSTARLDAQLLLGQVLMCTRVQLYAEYDKPLSTAERDALRPLVRRRTRGEPVAYILQRKEWHDMDLYVDSRVLIPRPETETLFDLYGAWLALQLEGGEHQEQKEHPEIMIFDLCTGSGCLALALARRFPRATVIGVDKSTDALAVAALNAERLGVRNVTWIESDVTAKHFWENLVARVDAMPGVPGSRACAIVSNPPYVSAREWEECAPEVRDFEPRMALVPEGDTLFVSESILDGWLHVVKSSGGGTIFYLGMEGGIDHPEAILAHRIPQIGDDDEPRFPVFRAADPARTYPSVWQKENDAVSGTHFPFVCEDLEGKPRFLFASALSK